MTKKSDNVMNVSLPFADDARSPQTDTAAKPEGGDVKPTSEKGPVAAADKIT